MQEGFCIKVPECATMSVDEVRDVSICDHFCHQNSECVQNEGHVVQMNSLNLATEGHDGRLREMTESD